MPETEDEDEGDPAEVVDLVAARRASVDAAKARRGESGSSGSQDTTRPTAEKTAKKAASKPAKKSAAKKSTARRAAAKHWPLLSSGVPRPFRTREPSSRPTYPARR